MSFSNVDPVTVLEFVKSQHPQDYVTVICEANVLAIPDNPEQYTFDNGDLVVYYISRISSSEDKQKQFEEFVAAQDNNNVVISNDPYKDVKSEDAVAATETEEVVQAPVEAHHTKPKQSLTSDLQARLDALREEFHKPLPAQAKTGSLFKPKHTPRVHEILREQEAIQGRIESGRRLLHKIQAHTSVPEVDKLSRQLGL